MNFPDPDFLLLSFSILRPLSSLRIPSVYSYIWPPLQKNSQSTDPKKEHLHRIQEYYILQLNLNFYFLGVRVNWFL